MRITLALMILRGCAGLSETFVVRMQQRFSQVGHNNIYVEFLPNTVCRLFLKASKEYTAIVRMLVFVITVIVCSNIVFVVVHEQPLENPSFYVHFL